MAVSVFELFGEIGVDTSKFETSMKGVDGRLRDAKGRFIAGARDAKKFGDTINAQSRQLTELENSLAKQIQTSIKAGQTSNVTMRSFEKQRETLAKLRGELQTVANQYTANGKVSQDMERKLAGVTRGLSGFNSKLKDTEARLKDTTNAQNSFAKSLKSLGNAGNQMQGLGASLTIGVTAPILAIGGLATKTGMEYETAMNIFQKATRATVEEMKIAEKLAIDLGADLNLPATSAKDAANAMTELGKQGMTARQAMEATRGSLLLATAANIDAASAAEINASALNMFNLEATKSAFVADLLAGAANSSAAEIGDVATSLQQAGAVFANAKIPIEDLTTAIAIMANRGIKGSDAGTSLKTMLQRLQSPTDNASDAMKSLGIKIFDAQGKMKPFKDIIGQFEKSLSKLSEEQKAQALNTIFGADAVRVATIIFGAGAKGFDQMREAVMRANSAQDMAAARTKGLGGAWEAFKSQLETIGLVLYNKVKTPLTEITSFLGNMAGQAMQAFEALPAPIQAAIAALLGVAAVAGPIIAIVGTIAAAIAAIGAPIIAAVTAVTVIFGVLAADLAAKAVIIYQAWQANFGGIRDFTTQAVSGIKTAWADIVGYFTSGEGVAWIQGFKAAWAELKAVIPPIVQGISNAIREFLGGVVTWVKQNYPTIKEIISSVMTAIKVVVVTALVAIRAFWSEHGEAIKTVVQGMWFVVSNLVRGGLAYMRAIFSAALRLINGDWMGAWLILVNLFISFINKLFALNTWITGKMKELGYSIIQGVINGVKEKASSLYSAIKGVMFGTTQSAKEAVDSHSPSRVFMQIGADIIAGLVIGIQNNAPKAVAAIQDVAAQIENVFKKRDNQKFFDFMTPAREGAAKLTDKLRELKNIIDGEKSELQKVNELFKDPKVQMALSYMSKELRAQTESLLRRNAALVDHNNLIKQWENIMQNVPDVPAPSLASSGEDKTVTVADMGDVGTPPKLKAAWEDFFGTFKARLNEIKESLPSVNELLGETFLSGIEGIADVFGQAIRAGSDFFSELKRGFIDLGLYILQTIAKLLIMKAILSAIGGGANSGGGFFDSIKGIIGGNNGGGIGGIIKNFLGFGGKAATSAATSAITSGAGAAAGAGALGAALAGSASGASAGGIGAGLGASAGAATGGGMFAGLAAFMTNPITMIALPAIVGGLLLWKHFKNRTEKKLRDAIGKTYAVQIKDMSVLKQIKELGEAQFGKGNVSKKLLETIQLPQSKDLIRNYAETTGQSTAKLGPSTAQLQDENWAGNIMRREFGGPVTAGVPYIVGERRAELFVPNQSGYIHPSVPSNGGNDAMMQGVLIEAIRKLDAKISSMSPEDIVTVAAERNSGKFYSAMLDAADKNSSMNERNLRTTGLAI